MLTSLGVEARWEVLAGDQQFSTSPNESVMRYKARNCRLPIRCPNLAQDHQSERPVLNFDATCYGPRPEPAGYRTSQSGKWIWPLLSGSFTSLSATPGVSLRQFCVRYDAAIFPSADLPNRLPIPKFLILSVDRSVKRKEPGDVASRSEPEDGEPRDSRTSRFCCRWRASIALKIRSERSQPTEW